MVCSLRLLKVVRLVFMKLICCLLKLMGRQFEGVWLSNCVIGGGVVLVVKGFERESCLGCGRNDVTNGREIDRILATG